MDAITEAALAGDMTAARLMLDRVLPPLKSVDAPVALAAMSAAQTLTSKADAIVAAAAGGELTPTQAVALMQTLTGLARAVEVDELTRRVAALEEGSRHDD